MLQYIETHAGILYAIAFSGTMVGVVFWEVQAPLRQPVFSHRVRWLSNFGVYVLNTLLLYLLLPMSAVALAVILAERGWGLFNNLSAPLPVAIAASILALDGLHYLKHVVLHKVPLLWRFHRVHHTDLDYDFTTGIRFHPLESIVNAVITMTVIALLGSPAAAVVIFETSLVLVTFIVHANIRYPATIDKVFRTLLVTPDMHRIHHSARAAETDSNYGVIFSWWDRLFGTHVAQPLNGHTGMSLGLLEFRESKHQTLPWMLACPFLDIARNQAGVEQERVALKVQE
jgi:sterol desaturase/sphingolipid hydroxylase (fatty acid hydroxylase superfamily)